MFFCGREDSVILCGFSWYQCHTVVTDSFYLAKTGQVSLNSSWSFDNTVIGRFYVKHVSKCFVLFIFSLLRYRYFRENGV